MNHDNKYHRHYLLYHHFRPFRQNYSNILRQFGLGQKADEIDSTGGEG